MYKLITKLGLQIFAGEGAGSGGEGGADGGASAQAESGLANQETSSPSLESLGVPKDKAEKYRQRKGITATETVQTATPVTQQNTEQIVTADTTQQQEQTEAPKSLKDILKSNPQFNQEAQEMITGRVKGLKSRLADVEPILEILGNNYGMDTSDLSKLDLKALASKVSDDNKYYEDIAADMGTDIETAKRITKLERDAKKAERQAAETENENRLRDHYNGLQQQASVLQQTIPGFNLDAELQNPTFMRMTSPEGGLSVEQAFYALHYKEINKFNQAQTAQNVAKAMSNSIQAGRSMPTENGTVQRAASTVQQKAYHDMNAQERSEFMRQLKSGKRF